jgi:ribonuclease HI
MDSELVVKQMNGLYKVKELRLKKLYTEAILLKNKFSKVSFTHIKRSQNKRADELVNEALDKNGS